MSNKIIYDFTENDKLEVILGIHICNYVIPLCKEA